MASNLSSMINYLTSLTITQPNSTTMVSSNQSQTPLYDLPEETFQHIISYITEPADYFHLAATSRLMMDKLDPQRVVLLLEERKLREHVEQFPPGGSRWVRLAFHPLNSVMNWALRTKQPGRILWNVVQDYLTYFPDVVHGNAELGLEPAWRRAIAYNNAEAVILLTNAGLAPA